MLKIEILMEVYRIFYCKVNSVLCDFIDIPYDVKIRLLGTYCLNLYGSQLWNYSKHDVNHFMLHDVKLFDDFGKFLIQHTAIYYRRSTRLNQ